MEHFWTEKEAIKNLKISRMTLYNKRKQNKIKFIKKYGKILYPSFQFVKQKVQKDKALLLLRKLQELHGYKPVLAKKFKKESVDLGISDDMFKRYLRYLKGIDTRVKLYKKGGLLKIRYNFIPIMWEDWEETTPLSDEEVDNDHTPPDFEYLCEKFGTKTVEVKKIMDDLISYWDEEFIYKWLKDLAEQDLVRPKTEENCGSFWVSKIKIFPL